MEPIPLDDPIKYLKGWESPSTVLYLTSNYCKDSEFYKSLHQLGRLLILVLELGRGGAGGVNYFIDMAWKSRPLKWAMRPPSRIRFFFNFNHWSYVARGGCVGLRNTSYTTAVQRLLGLLVGLLRAYVEVASPSLYYTVINLHQLQSLSAIYEGLLVLCVITRVWIYTEVARL